MNDGGVFIVGPPPPTVAAVTAAKLCGSHAHLPVIFFVWPALLCICVAAVNAAPQLAAAAAL
jgi:hypothetical protein